MVPVVHFRDGFWFDTYVCRYSFIYQIIWHHLLLAELIHVIARTCKMNDLITQSWGIGRTEIALPNGAICILGWFKDMFRPFGERERVSH